MDFSALTASEIVDGLTQREFQATDCVDHFLKRIESARSLNAFVVGDENSQAAIASAARKSAAEMDHRRARSESLGSLAGLPVAIKDGICTKDRLTTAGSKMLQSFVAPYDATSVKLLQDASAISIGKTNMDEFAMGSSTENSVFGPTLNPFNLDHVPGGSSGGSAAAVAAGLAPCALGSDTGGSIRQPASFCGITGLKPTYGRVSRNGLIAFASSLDQIGPMTRSSKDCAMLMNVLAHHDAADSTSSSRHAEDYLASLEHSIAGLKIGVCQSWFSDGLNEEVAAAVRESIKVLKSLGATIVDIELPHAAYGVATYYVIAPCEASSNLSRYDGVRYSYRHSEESLDQMYCESRGHGFGAEVRRRIMLGTFALSSGYYDAYYLKASRMRRAIKQDYDAAFEKVDVIAGPTTPTTAFKLGQHAQNPLAMYLADVFTVTANLAGIPAMSLPCGFDSKGLPIGLQLQGRWFDEATMLRAGHQYQQQTDFHLKRPPRDGGMATESGTGAQV